MSVQHCFAHIVHYTTAPVSPPTPSTDCVAAENRELQNRTLAGDIALLQAAHLALGATLVQGRGGRSDKVADYILSLIDGSGKSKIVCQNNNLLFEILKVGRQGEFFKNNKFYWKVVVTVFSSKDAAQQVQMSVFLSVGHQVEIIPLSTSQ